MESLPSLGLQDQCLVTDEQQYITNKFGRTLGEHQDMIQIRDKKWEELACINEGRCNALRSALNGKIYIAGGIKTTCPL